MVPRGNSISQGPASVKSCMISPEKKKRKNSNRKPIQGGRLRGGAPGEGRFRPKKEKNLLGGRGFDVSDSSGRRGAPAVVEGQP